MEIPPDLILPVGDHLTLRHYGEMMPMDAHDVLLPEVIGLSHRIQVEWPVGIRVGLTGVGTLWHSNRGSSPVRSTLVLLIDDWKNHLQLIRASLPLESKVRTYLPHISLTEDDPMGNTAFPRYVSPRNIVIPHENIFISIGGERIYCGS